MSALETFGRNILLSSNSKRKEYGFVWKHLSSCEKILDVSCGVGLFLHYAPERILGVDINYRHPPLYYSMMYGSRNRLRVSMALNVLQCKYGLRKYWTFDAYTIVLENRKQPSAEPVASGVSADLLQN
jgi:hypothetical protein